MRNFEDKFAKWLLGALLREFGQVTTDQEVVETGQRIDLWFESRTWEGLSLARLLGRMAVESIMIEVFSGAPNERDVRECRRKQANWEHQLYLEAGHPGRRPQDPPLWIISSERPAKVLNALDFRPMPGWPRGVYESQGTRLIVLAELPSTRDTLLLRLLGRRNRRLQAIHFIETLTDDALEKRILFPVLRLVYGENMTQPKSSLTKEDLEVDPRDVFNRFLSEAKDNGRKEGRLDGLKDGRLEGLKDGRLEGERRVILRQCEYKFGKLSEARQSQIESASLDQLKTWTTRLLTATKLDEVFNHAPE